MNFSRKNFGIIIIGNEILSGKTIDTNSNYICKQLNAIGMVCKEINVVRDSEKDIVEKINTFRKKYDYIFTTGGIGPTHDDITAKAVSKALNDPLVLNNVAKKRLEKHYSDDVLTKARLKMAYMPSKALLIDNPVSVAPGFYVKNIYVLPGVPNILKPMFKELLKNFTFNKKFIKKTLSTHLSEGIIGEYIEKIQKKYEKLEIGSYPYFKKIHLVFL